jgi:uncharacterized protein YaiI (UPF0178 family)
MMKVLVDADACPKAVLTMCLEMGKKHHIPVWTVASFNHNIKSDHHIVVGDASQEADIKLLNLSEANDVVVTQDWGLAAMLLGRGVFCLSPDGWEFQSGNIEFLLEVREAKAKHRRGGGKTKGPKKRSVSDDNRFAEKLSELLKLAMQGK